MAKAGRPGWTPPDPSIVEAMAAQGLTEKQIAESLGICQDTLIRKKKQFSEFSEAIKRGQAKGIAVVTSALMNQIKSGSVPAAIFYLKARAGWRETQVVQLKNFDPKKMSTEELEAIARAAENQSDPE